MISILPRIGAIFLFLIFYSTSEPPASRKMEGKREQLGVEESTNPLLDDPADSVYL
jgi:hypothetical protein